MSQHLTSNAPHRQSNPGPVVAAIGSGRTAPAPLPAGGDLVVVLTSADPTIAAGATGIVEGLLTGNFQQTTVVFGTEPPYRDGIHCRAHDSAALRRTVCTVRLLSSGRTARRTFWRWRNQQEQRTETYRETVRVWGLCLGIGRRPAGLNVRIDT